MKSGIIIRSLLVFLILSATTFGFARPTGSFNISISFNGGSRQLSLYVPTDYDSTKKYNLMICLHGLGDNSSNYRDALMNSLGWKTNIPNTIFVCPESSTATSDYFTPAGGQEIINESINYAMNNYNVDGTNIVLQGFSLGGRAALRFALDNPVLFKGILLNTPAIQGVKEGSNLSFYKCNYSNASKLKVYITHGETDVFYTGPIDSMYEQLILNDCKVTFKRVPGLAHNIPAFSIIQDFPAFFSGPGSNSPNARIAHIITPQRTCATNVPVNVLIQNTSMNKLKSIKFQYDIGGGSKTYDWNGDLKSYEHTYITLPVISSATGNNTLTVKVISLNDTTVSLEKSEKVTVTANGLSLPIFEGFEAPDFPPANWVYQRSGEVYAEFDVDNTVKRSGTQSFVGYNTILLFDNAKRKEELLSPVMDFTSVSKPEVSFDIAYNYDHYFPPVFSKDSVFADTLELLVSTDCGDSYTRIFKKGGKDLATFAKPIENATSLQATFITPKDSNWRNIKLDLSAYGTAKEAVVMFRYISALGGMMYIDNVRFGNTTASIQKAIDNNIQLYPNPTNSTFTISSPYEEITKVTIRDLSGKSILQISPEVKVINIDVSSWKAGVYLIEIDDENGSTYEKLLKGGN